MSLVLGCSGQGLGMTVHVLGFGVRGRLSRLVSPAEGFGVGVQGLGVQGLACKGRGLRGFGFRVWGLKFSGVQNLGCGVKGLGFR